MFRRFYPQTNFIMTEMSRIENAPLTGHSEVTEEKDLTCCETLSSWVGLNWCCQSGIPEENLGVSPFQDKRACTDVVCCLLFVALWVMMLSIYGSAFGEAELSLLLGSVNYQGKSCAAHEVAFAPTTEDFGLLLCAENCTVTQSNILPESYESNADWRGVCVSTDEEGIFSIPGWQSDWFKSALEDMKNAWQILLVSALVSLVLTILIGLLIKYVACCVVIISVSIVTLGGAATGYFLFTESLGADYGANQRIVAYIIWSLVVLFLIVICCLAQRIYLALEIIDAAVDVITDMVQLLFLPFLPMILGLAFISFWIVGLLYIHASFGTLESASTPSEVVGITIQGQYIDETYMQYQASDDWFSNTTWACVFFLFINLQFIIYFNYYVNAGAISEWYFSRYQNLRENRGPKIRGDAEDELGSSPICDAICRFLRYNVGTVVFAAFVIAVIETLKAFVEYIRSHTQGDTCCMQVISKMLCCCICCVDFLNRQALIMSAMQGYAFCPGAQYSSKLIWNNLARVAIVQVVGGLAVKVGVLAVVGGTAAFCVLALQWQQQVEHLTIPVITAVVIALIVSSLFLGVIDNAVDVVFFCFLVDENFYDQAQYAPEDLKLFLYKHSKTSEEIAARKRGVPPMAEADIVSV